LTAQVGPALAPEIGATLAAEVGPALAAEVGPALAPEVGAALPVGGAARYIRDRVANGEDDPRYTQEQGSPEATAITKVIRAQTQTPISLRTLWKEHLNFPDDLFFF
jgi:hypothetical protein